MAAWPRTAIKSMKPRLKIIFLLPFLFTSSTFASPPFLPKVVDTLGESLELPHGMTRLRISVASSEERPESGVRLGGVVACSRTECYQAATPGAFNVDNTARGAATLITNLAVPPTTIESVHFLDAAGSPTISGEIKLKQPVTLTGHGSEIFVMLKRQVDRSLATYIPTEVTSEIWGFVQSTIYYNPKFATSVDLKFDTKVFVPKNSTSESTIIRVAMHRSGKVFPDMDIFPEINFLEPLTVDVNEIIYDWMKPGYSGPPSILNPTLETDRIPLFKDTGVPGKYTEKITKGGFHVFDPTDETLDGKPRVRRTLQETLDFMDRRNLSRSLPEGTFVDKCCVTSPPHVHIAVTNIKRKGVTLQLAANAHTYKDNKLQLDLTKITKFHDDALIAINGFTWEGDYGIGPGKGFAKGYVSDSGRVLGDNRREGGYTSVSSGISDGNKLVLRWSYDGRFEWVEEAKAIAFDRTTLPYTVSSSTSVVKNGVCAASTDSNRWSAIGTSPDGKVVFVSSTSEEQTTAAALCAVFQKYGVTNAIRLDGGPSASLLVNGELLNPLRGMYNVAFGDMRNVAYGLILRTGNW